MVYSKKDYSDKTVSKASIVFIGPMRIPIPAEKGAVEDIIWQLSKRLKRYYRVFIYNPINTCILNDVIKALLLKYMKNSYYDNNIIIHSHNIFGSIGIITNLHSAKHVLTLHYPPWYTKSVWRRRLLLGILRILHNKGVILTVPSLTIMEWLRKKEIRNTFFLPNGVDTSMFNYRKRDPELREKLLNGHEILIVNVGRICFEKNQISLLKILPSLISEYKSIKLILIGPIGSHNEKSLKSRDYKYYTLLKEYIKKYSLEKYVSYLGTPSKEEVARILASSDIYVHPSLVEAAPLVILEAMASGLPIVAFNLSVYKGYLFDNINVLFATPFNIKDLRDKMLSIILDQNMRNRLAYNALKIAHNIFSWDRLIRKYISFYNELLIQEETYKYR